MSERELLPCPFCGREPRVCPDDSYGACQVFCPGEHQDCEAHPSIHMEKDQLGEAIAAWNRRSPSRREVLEEAARVADKHYQESKKSAAYYKSLPKDDGSYGQCLADMIVAGDIAIAIRALAEEK